MCKIELLHTFQPSKLPLPQEGARQTNGVMSNMNPEAATEAYTVAMQTLATAEKQGTAVAKTQKSADGTTNGITKSANGTTKPTGKNQITAAANVPRGNIKEQMKTHHAQLALVKPVDLASAKSPKKPATHTKADAKIAETATKTEGNNVSSIQPSTARIVDTGAVNTNAEAKKLILDPVTSVAPAISVASANSGLMTPRNNAAATNATTKARTASIVHPENVVPRLRFNSGGLVAAARNVAQLHFGGDASHLNHLGLGFSTAINGAVPGFAGSANTGPAGLTDTLPAQAKISTSGEAVSAEPVLEPSDAEAQAELKFQAANLRLQADVYSAWAALSGKTPGSAPEVSAVGEEPVTLTSDHIAASAMEKPQVQDTSATHNLNLNTTPEHTAEPVAEFTPENQAADIEFTARSIPGIPLQLVDFEPGMRNDGMSSKEYWAGMKQRDAIRKKNRRARRQAAREAKAAEEAKEAAALEANQAKDPQSAAKTDAEKVMLDILKNDGAASSEISTGANKEGEKLSDKKSDTQSDCALTEKDVLPNEPISAEKTTGQATEGTTEGRVEGSESPVNTLSQAANQLLSVNHLQGSGDQKSKFEGENFWGEDESQVAAERMQDAARYSERACKDFRRASATPPPLCELLSEVEGEAGEFEGELAGEFGGANEWGVGKGSQGELEVKEVEKNQMSRTIAEVTEVKNATTDAAKNSSAVTTEDVKPATETVAQQKTVQTATTNLYSKFNGNGIQVAAENKSTNSVPVKQETTDEVHTNQTGNTVTHPTSTSVIAQNQNAHQNQNVHQSPNMFQNLNAQNTDHNVQNFYANQAQQQVGQNVQQMNFQQNGMQENNM